MTRPIHFAATLTTLTAAFFLAPTAGAAECTSDADCTDSFTCEVVGGSDCAGVACPDGQECPTEPVCEPVEYRECVPGPCASDADCSDGMTCHTETYEVCTATDVTCPEGEPCPEPEPAECFAETQSRCVYPHELPCAVDADCGEGFSCAPFEMCSCGGAAPAPDPDGSSSDLAPVPPECFCEQSAPVCQPQTIACSADSDCPAQWTCMTGATSGGSCYVELLPDGTTSDPVCTEAEPAPSECVPPSSGVGFGYDSEQASGSGADGKGTTASDGEAGSEDPNGDIGADPSPPADSMDDVATEGSGTSSSGDDGSCTLAAPGRGSSGGTALAMSVLAGLAAVSRRRRARRA